MLLKFFLICVNFGLPGLGTLFMGKPGQGIAQLVLAVIGFFLMLTVFLSILGLIIWVAAWVWALVVGIQWTPGGASSVKVRAL